MIKCGYCGKEVKDDAQFCSNCGHSIEEPSEEGTELPKGEKGAYAAPVLTLMIVLALLALGGFQIIYRNLHPTQTVSSSDTERGTFNYNSAVIDPALVGKWLCTDRAAADYSKKNFGVEVKILLNLTEDGRFTLDYSMTDTGIKAKSLSSSGSYSTEDSIITFLPEENPGIEDYLKRHGQRPSFQYAADGGSFSIRYENGKDILFKPVKD